MGMWRTFTTPAGGRGARYLTVSPYVALPMFWSVFNAIPPFLFVVYCFTSGRPFVRIAGWFAPDRHAGRDWRGVPAVAHRPRRAGHAPRHRHGRQLPHPPGDKAHPRPAAARLAPCPGIDEHVA